MPERTLLTNATIVLDSQAPALAGATLVIEGDRIVEVRQSKAHSQSEVAEHTRVINLDGAYVLPGLIDSHSHLSYTPQVGTPSSLNFTHSIEMNTVVAVTNADTYLKRGFTGLFDMGARGNIAIAVRDAIEADVLPGPRVIASGPVLSATGGLMNNAPAWVQFNDPNGVPVNGVVEVQRAVRQQILAGVDNIKIGASGQLANPTAFTQLLTERELEAAVHEAERHGKTVAAHAYGEEAVSACIRSGVHSVHHGFGGLSEKNLELMAEMGTYLVPTVGVFEEVLANGSHKRWPSEKQYRFERGMDQLCSALASIVGTELESRVLAGSDSGNSVGQEFAANEIVSLARNGFGPEAALRTATSNAAGALGRTSDVGTIAPGKLADLVVFGESPVENIQTLTSPSSVKLVMKGGRVVHSTDKKGH